MGQKFWTLCLEIYHFCMILRNSVLQGSDFLTPFYNIGPCKNDKSRDMGFRISDPLRSQ
jgi:hypothetical protein